MLYFFPRYCPGPHFYAVSVLCIYGEMSLRAVCRLRLPVFSAPGPGRYVHTSIHFPPLTPTTYARKGEKGPRASTC